MVVPLLGAYHIKQDHVYRQKWVRTESEIIYMTDIEPNTALVFKRNGVNCRSQIFYKEK